MKNQQKSKYYKQVKPLLDEGKVQQWAQTETIEEIAKRCGVSIPTFRAYMSTYPQLKEAVEKGRAEKIKTIKDSLLMLACGYHTTETTTTLTERIDDDTIKKTTVKKTEVAPSLRAIALLLTNLDDSFTSVDKSTRDYREKLLELQKERIEAKTDTWEEISTNNNLDNID